MICNKSYMNMYRYMKCIFISLRRSPLVVVHAYVPTQSKALHGCSIRVGTEEEARGQDTLHQQHGPSQR